MSDATISGGWRPGMPVLSEHDRAEWQIWRHERALELQRERRKRLRRIDYYATSEAVEIIDRMRTRSAGGDASSILNRIVADWSAAMFPELNKRK